VIGNLAMVAEDLPAGNLHREMVDRAYLAAERGAKLTHRMLAFSRKQTLSPSSVDLNELTEEMRDILRVTLSETVEVALRLAPDLWLCWVDRVQMENSLLNLAINSRDAMPRGGRLVIETENVVLDEEQAESFEDVAPGEYVRLSISDNGCGIPQEYLDRVFEPFFSTKEVGQGSGLGLSMIYGFAKQSGGHVTIESEEGAGTTVTHYLPRWKDGDDGKGDD
jgi:signal transduction histidine kinase